MHTIDKNCIEKFYNNIYCEYKTKHLFLYYLITYREQNKTNMIDDIIEVLKKLCLEWDAATTLLLKSMITSSALVFDKYKKRILNVIDYEKRMVYNVMNRYTEMLYDSTLF